MTRLLGLNPSHEAKCLAVGHLVISAPTSLITFNAVQASTPLIRVRSTPVIRYRWPGTSKRGAFPWMRFLLAVPQALRHRYGRQTAPSGFQSPGRTRQSWPDTPGATPGLGQLEDVLLLPVPLQR